MKSLKLLPLTFIFALTVGCGPGAEGTRDGHAGHKHADHDHDHADHDHAHGDHKDCPHKKAEEDKARIKREHNEKMKQINAEHDAKMEEARRKFANDMQERARKLFETTINSDKAKLATLIQTRDGFKRSMATMDAKEEKHCNEIQSKDEATRERMKAFFPCDGSYRQNLPYKSFEKHAAELDALIAKKEKEIAEAEEQFAKM